MNSDQAVLMFVVLGLLAASGLCEEVEVKTTLNNPPKPPHRPNLNIGHSIKDFILPPFHPLPTYAPSTPLGALASLKGDLIAPIVVVGFVVAGIWLIALIIKTFVTSKLGILGSIFKHQSRRRRDAGHVDQLDHVTEVVMSALQSQECLYEAVCKLGMHARDFHETKNILFQLLDKFSTPSLQSMVKIFKSAAVGKDNCEKFTCNKTQ